MTITLAIPPGFYDGFKMPAWRAQSLGSTGLDPETMTNAYLDSVGCCVFADAFGTLTQMTWYQATAVAMAHELGHAIGLTHDAPPNDDNRGVMSSDIDTTEAYSRYSYFGPLTNEYLHEATEHKQMNLRQVLGRDAAEFWTYPLRTEDVYQGSYDQLGGKSER